MGKSRAGARPRSTRPGERNRFRIIAGQWRRRLLSFPPLPGLRPTPDRVRETLFNWLAPQVPGARCLDLFAGSGALGLEALSRGAASAVFVDRTQQVLVAIDGHLGTLGCQDGRVVQADVARFLRGPAMAFDLVFADPPFAEDWSGELCTLLQQGGWLAAGARVYLEGPAARGEPVLPAGWRLLRSTRAGEVLGCLLAPPAGDAGPGESEAGETEKRA